MACWRAISLVTKCCCSGAQALGLTRPAAVKRQFLHHVFRQLEEHTSEELQPRKRRDDDVLGDPDWAKVRWRLKPCMPFDA